MNPIGYDKVDIESPFKESTLKYVVLSMKEYLESVDESKLK